MEAKRSVDEEATDPLLSRVNPASENPGKIKSSHVTPVVIFSTFVAVLGSYVFGTTYSLFGLILTTGAMIGALMSGKIADYFGRRANNADNGAELFCVRGWLAILFAKHASLLDIGRFSVGYGIGIISFVLPSLKEVAVYIAEITPSNLRGAFTAANQLMICIGASVTYVIGNFLSWRVLALIGAAACLLQLIGLFIIPESPRWLDYTETIQQLSDSRLIDLFQIKYAHALVVGVGANGIATINAIAYYASAIFESAGFSSRAGTLAMVVIQVPMQVVGTLLMDKSGRRPLLMVSAPGTCSGCFLIALSFLLQDLQVWKYSSFLAFLGVLIFTGSFSIGIGAIPWVIMPEVFPISVKGLAGSLVTVVNWLGSWIISYSFNFLTEWITSGGTFLIFSIISGFTVAFVAKLVPETKGRTLEEIQASMVLFARER